MIKYQNKTLIHTHIIYAKDSLNRTTKRLEIVCEDGSTVMNLVGKPVTVVCENCLQEAIRNFYTALLNKPYICQRCNKLGNKNPFYGKSHTEHYKQNSRDRMAGKYLGTDNPFYGKTHSEQTRKKLSELNKLVYNPETTKLNRGPMSAAEKIKAAETIRNKWDALSAEEQLVIKQTRSNRCKLLQQRLKATDIDKYVEQRKFAGKMSCISQRKQYKQTKPEKAVAAILEKEFPKLFKYSVILNYYQFDFGCREHKILIEVHGDYWHANPAIYTQSHLTEAQNKNLMRDRVKKNWALDAGFTLITIWEHDINNKHFDDLIGEIRNAIKIDRIDRKD